MSKIDWTTEDNKASMMQGWSLFECCDGFFRIQKIDDAFEQSFEIFGEHPDDADKPLKEIPQLKSDAQALYLVKRLAKGGDQAAIKALSVHRKKIS